MGLMTWTPRYLHSPWEYPLIYLEPTVQVNIYIWAGHSKLIMMNDYKFKGIFQFYFSH